MPVDDLVLLGRVSDAHGLKGEVKIASFTADPLDLAAYGPLTSQSGARFEVLDIRGFKAGTVIARLSGVSSRNAAEALKGTELFVPRAALPETEDEEFYYAELIGLTATDPEGHTLGEVIALHNFGAGDLLEVRPAGGGATWLVPFTQTRVPEINVQAGRLVILPEAEPETTALDVMPPRAESA